MENTPPISVIVDTNTLTRTPDFSSTAWNKLILLHTQGHINLAVPHIVLEETGRQWAETTEEFFTNARTKWQHVTWPLPSYSSTPLPHHSDLTREKYVQHATLFLQEHNVKILPIPDVPIEDLLERDLAKRQPFEASGKGFRDALIWESVLAFMANEEKPGRLIFVTGDTKGFGSTEKELAENLRAELPDDWEFKWKLSLNQVTQDQALQPLVKQLEISSPSGTISAELIHSDTGEQSPSIDELIFNAVDNQIQALVGFPLSHDRGYSVDGIVIRQLFIPARVNSLVIGGWRKDPSTFRVQQIKSYTDEQSLFHVHIDGTFDLFGALPSNEASILTDQELLTFTSATENYSVQVDIPVPVTIELAVWVNNSSRRVDSCTIDSIVAPTLE